MVTTQEATDMATQLCVVRALTQQQWLLTLHESQHGNHSCLSHDTAVGAVCSKLHAEMFINMDHFKVV